MRKLLLAASISLIFPSTAFADSVGQCGLGSKLFDGKKGVAPQVLAVTTNGTSGNQTFGITFGTLGCETDGVVKSGWRTAMFIDSNKTMLARDMSAGQGESLDALSGLLGMDEKDSQTFARLSQEEFTEIFSSKSVSTEDIISSLKQLLASNAELEKYSANI